MSDNSVTSEDFARLSAALENSTGSFANVAKRVQEEDVASAKKRKEITRMMGDGAKTFGRKAHDFALDIDRMSGSAKDFSDGIQHMLQGGLFGKLGGQIMARVLDNTAQLAANYRELAAAGQNFAGGMVEMGKIAGQAGLSMGEFQRVLIDNSRVAAAFGSQEMTQLMKRVRATSEQFGMYGYSLESMNSLTGEYLERMRIQGRLESLRDMGETRAAERMRKLAEETAVLSATFGKSREELTKGQTEMFTDLQYLMKMETMSAEERANYQANVDPVLKQIQAAFGDDFGMFASEAFGAGGAINTALGQALAQAGMGEVNATMDSILTRAQAGQISASEAEAEMRAMQQNLMQSGNFQVLASQLGGNAEAKRLLEMFFRERTDNNRGTDATALEAQTEAARQMVITTDEFHKSVMALPNQFESALGGLRANIFSGLQEALEAPEIQEFFSGMNSFIGNINETALFSGEIDFSHLTDQVSGFLQTSDSFIANMANFDFGSVDIAGLTDSFSSLGQGLMTFGESIVGLTKYIDEFALVVGSAITAFALAQTVKWGGRTIGGIADIARSTGLFGNNNRDGDRNTSPGRNRNGGGLLGGGADTNDFIRSVRYLTVDSARVVNVYGRRVNMRGGRRGLGGGLGDFGDNDRRNNRDNDNRNRRGGRFGRVGAAITGAVAGTVEGGRNLLQNDRLVGAAEKIGRFAGPIAAAGLLANDVLSLRRDSRELGEQEESGEISTDEYNSQMNENVAEIGITGGAAAAGAALGTALLPGIGTAIGTGVGALVGEGAKFFGLDEALADKMEESRLISGAMRLLGLNREEEPQAEPETPPVEVNVEEPQETRSARRDRRDGKEEEEITEVALEQKSVDPIVSSLTGIDKRLAPLELLPPQFASFTSSVMDLMQNGVRTLQQTSEDTKNAAENTEETAEATQQVTEDLAESQNIQRGGIEMIPSSLAEIAPEFLQGLTDSGLGNLAFGIERVLHDGMQSGLTEDEMANQIGTMAQNLLSENQQYLAMAQDNPELMNMIRNQEMFGAELLAAIHSSAQAEITEPEIVPDETPTNQAERRAEEEARRRAEMESQISEDERPPVPPPPPTKSTEALLLEQVLEQLRILNANYAEGIRTGTRNARMQASAIRDSQPI